MKRRKRINKEKALSAGVTCALVCALAVGVMSVVNNTKDKSGNIVDLNETKQQMAQLPTEGNTDGSNKLARNNDTIKEQDKEDSPVATVPATKPDKEDEVSREAGNIGQTVKDRSNGNKAGAAHNVAADSDSSVLAKYSFSENDTMKWPVKGDIIMKFSMDSTIYYKTLGLYKVNPAVNIAASAGTQVIAAASGVVRSVDNSEETGTTVSIAIGNDYVTTYGLLSDVTLKKGMTVVAGDVIGRVSEPTKYYSQEGSNLYFKLTRADEPIDPVIYFEQ